MADFEWAMPYTSQRMPVLARNIVATSQPLAAQAGLRILQQGGNAVDAAVATAIAMTVLEPTTNGIGSDAFALIWDPKGNSGKGRLHGLNASGRAPMAVNPEKFTAMKSMPIKGWDPVTVPGAVSGWVMASQKFGKLQFERLFEPAIDYASNGFPVAPLTAALWKRAVNAYKDFPEWGKTFLNDQGVAPETGDVFKMPGHAQTLRMISESHGEAFYRGILAKKIAATAHAEGGLMTVEDLASHTADWVDPISLEYGHQRLHEIPPNGQGIAALIALGILKHFDVGKLAPDCPDVLHLQIEAMKLAFADAHQYIADPGYMKVTCAEILDDQYLATRAKLIDPSKAQDFNFGTPKPGGTILLTTADADGMMVSWIQSQYMGFGSGAVIPGTGIAMQNRGACFEVTPGHVNQIGPGKRPYHTIIPGFASRPGNNGDTPMMAFGVMGGFMQPQGHLQVFTRIFEYNQNPQAALDAPRWQVMAGMKVTIEPGYATSVYEELKNRGHDIELAEERSVSFGRGQAIYRLDNGTYCAGSDLRADGQAVGY
ncbi:MAG TPA: gamma-glutamyltransferase family protein [Phycisphaerales bacterium]|nr:gamma-glutamyltransferase family protein [Phycisphaerales bacterium]